MESQLDATASTPPAPPAATTNVCRYTASVDVSAFGLRIVAEDGTAYIEYPILDHYITPKEMEYVFEVLNGLEAKRVLEDIQIPLCLVGKPIRYFWDATPETLLRHLRENLCSRLWAMRTADHLLTTAHNKVIELQDSNAQPDEQNAASEARRIAAARYAKAGERNEETMVELYSLLRHLTNRAPVEIIELVLRDLEHSLEPPVSH
jgi:hypothetical protein